jgi:hypothetical protein
LLWFYLEVYFYDLIISDLTRAKKYRSRLRIFEAPEAWSPVQASFETPCDR